MEIWATLRLLNVRSPRHSCMCIPLTCCVAYPCTVPYRAKAMYLCPSALPSLTGIIDPLHSTHQTWHGRSLTPQSWPSRQGASRAQTPSPPCPWPVPARRSSRRRLGSRPESDPRQYGVGGSPLRWQGGTRWPKARGRCRRGKRTLWPMRRGRVRGGEAGGIGDHASQRRRRTCQSRLLRSVRVRAGAERVDKITH